MTQLWSQPDYSRIQRGSGLYDSGPQVIYLTIVLLIKRHFLGQWSTIIQITPINYQKHTHDWRHNCGVALAVLGNQENRERVLFSAPDSRFPLFNTTFATILMATDQQWSNHPINLQKHTYEGQPSCKATLTIYKQNEEVQRRFSAPYWTSQLSTSK